MSSSSKETATASRLTMASEILSRGIAPLIYFVSAVYPHFVSVVTAGHAVYRRLPHDGLHALLGLIFCFFGGIYPTLFAALQAAKHGGWENTKAAVADLSREAAVILEESRKDDEVDDDDDGVADVLQIDGKALAKRKAQLVLEKCDPAKINAALGHLYVTWTAVVLALKVQFARTIALSLSIAETIHGPAERFLQPTVAAVLPQKFHKWLPVLIDWTCKSVGMSVAWYVQTIISAFTSATYGGLKCARSLVKLCAKQKITLFGLLPKDHTQTSLDEIVGWLLAAAGFYFQFKLGFDIPFPFNLVLWPLETAEWYIRWTITSD
uniref:Uncharacterized protein n=1 Tax=Corethron hystrix TaxID=216773 RepID=A0A7S1BF05_9STRA|eukprot:CAMPEP_0113315380 /NCGR_PEP_ID=MMETSP0010_2-20120614/11071_1 /TAXON_ID=216773 ORGANISM="Corethron hystrix, Strain 308" /NCGR_SAMPLE_ID=MMETSP0010_2 /ASSEMBLY_ACC=CAM_ASM_000155 /LENGTH=322 /DNA_ID=CAMNT_0000171869 /DNA_START=13 /DNA_END=981 /DNA_ORIENTATION=+ /assembly_acc=CAM_ASM_000155